MSENFSIDTRSFPEIWAALSKDERDELSLKLFQNKCCRSRQAIHYWGKGEKSPLNPLVRETVAKVVTKQIGAKVLTQTLFPR